MTEEDQREMTTAQVVQAYIAGVIDADTFIWREGMDDWLTAFEIPQIGEGLRARGVRPPQLPTDPAEAAPQDDTVVQPLAAQSAQARTPSHTGTWREPGRWAPGDDKRRPPSDSDISFDDVTVAMAPPQAQQLLEAATERALQSAPENEEDTIVATSEFRAGDNGPVDALLGALGQPAQVTAPADDLRQADPWAARAPATSAPDSEPPSSAKRPAALRRDPEPATEPVDLFGAAALRAGSEAEQREQQVAAEQSRAAPTSPREDVALTGARHETSVLFSLDQLAKKEPPKPKRPQRPQESDADFLVSGSSPNTAHPGFAPVMTAPDFNAPPPSVQSSPPSAPAPARVAEKKSSNAGLWALLGFLVVGGLGLGGYFYVKQRSAQTAPTFEPAPTPPPQAAATVAPAPTAPATATTPTTATAPSPTAPVATDTAAPPAIDPKPATARPAPAPPRPGAVAPKQPAPGAAPAPAAQPPPAAAGAPFNKEAAAAALASAAANAASTCAQPDGPTGSGRVTVTFSPTGRATQALVGGDFAGTSAGGCIAKVFRQATIPPFSGPPTTVAKTVRVP